ncbi:MAG: hypothetical protein HY286_01185 [Planctomycetes bacterium]|nr:hypothetical protein [Planctomycetota bacterium]
MKSNKPPANTPAADAAQPSKRKKGEIVGILVNIQQRDAFEIGGARVVKINLSAGEQLTALSDAFGGNIMAEKDLPDMRVAVLLHAGEWS